MIHLKDINKTYQGAQPLHVLKGISLDIQKGIFLQLLPMGGLALLLLPVSPLGLAAVEWRIGQNGQSMLLAHSV